MFTKIQLAEKWDCSVKTVERDIRRWGLVPSDIKGRLQLFDEKDVAYMEERRRIERLTQNGYQPRASIISVKQAKRLAGKGAR